MSKEITVFITTKELYQFHSMPYGLELNYGHCHISEAFAKGSYRTERKDFSTWMLVTWDWEQSSLCGWREGNSLSLKDFMGNRVE